MVVLFTLSMDVVGLLVVSVMPDCVSSIIKVARRIHIMYNYPLLLYVLLCKT